jgi:hypothetical protein
MDILSHPDIEDENIFTHSRHIYLPLDINDEQTPVFKINNLKNIL